MLEVAVRRVDVTSEPTDILREMGVPDASSDVISIRSGAGSVSSTDEVLLHIGTHKTGTTSFQHWARASERELRLERNVAVYNGFLSHNHSEFALLSMRSNRTMYKKKSVPEWCLDEWQAQVREHIGRQVGQAGVRLLVSSEALSLLRHDDEIDALRQLLAPRTVRVAVCLRDPDDFLRSYRATIARRRELPSPYADSYRYVEPDSWLVDYEALVAVYGRAFGEDAVIAFPYEPAVEKHGSTIPCILQSLGIEPAGLPPWSGFRVNETPAPRNLLARVRLAAGLARQTILQPSEK